FCNNADWNANVWFLIMTDGVFHLAMFAALIIALWMLWRGDVRPERLAANTLIGFGSWHVFDAVLSHGVLGIHRIKDAAANPLLWDLGWVAAFGFVPIALGLLALRRPPPPMRGIRILLLMAAVGMGALNAVPIVEPKGPVIVAFAPNTSFASITRAAEAVGANLITTDASGGVWALDMPEDAEWWRLYLHGAVMVGRGPAAGCLAWTEA
ncbi:DUF2243 domain-containing protein, partial [Haematobacter missouriensis]